MISALTAKNILDINKNNSYINLKRPIINYERYKCDKKE